MWKQARTQYGQPLAITIMPAMYDIITTDASVEQVLVFSIVTTDYDYSHLHLVSTSFGQKTLIIMYLRLMLLHENADLVPSLTADCTTDILSDLVWMS